MKTKYSLTLLILVMVLISCNPVVNVAPRTENFSFVFKHTPCGSIPKNVFDSAGGVLTHTPLGDTISITISLRLTDDELESIYQKAISIQFFDYPSNFTVPNNQTLGFQTPASSYELNMKNGDISNSVTWTDDILTKPDYTNDDSLRELLQLINDIIQSHPEYKQVPEPKMFCL